MYEKGKCSLGEQCKHPEGDLRPKYQCFFCVLQLHPVVFGCSEVHDDDKVKCIDGCGISDDISEQSQLTNILVYARKPTRNKEQEFNMTRYPTAPSKQVKQSQLNVGLPTQQKKKQVYAKTQKKLPSAKAAVGRKKGSGAPLRLTSGDWFRACETFVSLKVKQSQAQFLKSNLSGPLIQGTRSEQCSFSANLKKYKKGELKNVEMKRVRTRQFAAVEEILVQYLKLRELNYKRDKLGISWLLMIEKCLKWAEDLGVEDFKASDGWLNNTLKYHNMQRIRLHGEADDLTDEEVKAAMDPFRAELQELAEDKGVGPSCMYNADQTGFFYQKLPNSMYVQTDKRKQFKGTKQMKDKTRVTAMICTAADGFRLPVAIIGKAKKPVCFDLLQASQLTPLPYTHQKNAWFDKDITIWWINNVFWLSHLQENGHVNAILILDNCSAHKIDVSKISSRITIKFLPPNVTSRHQPADMGMIAALKTGYKALYLRQLLQIFDVPGGYEQAAVTRRRQKPGQKGIQYGGKPHILDCMTMMKQIWNGEDGKYVSTESIRRCWRKADILPITWNIDINNEVGHASTPEWKKVVSNDTCNELCNLMNSIKLRANECSIDTTTAVGNVFRDTFVTDGDISNDDFHDMAEAWVNIEDNEDMINEIIDDELLLVDAIDKNLDDADNEDDEEEEIETSTEKKTKHVDVLEAFATIESYFAENMLTKEYQLSISRLRYGVQTHRTQKPKKSPTIKSFFNSRKPN